MIAAQREQILYVAIDGADTNPGTQNAPFATLARAQSAARRLKQTTTDPITVFVRAGTYYVDQPLVFGPEDSGSAEAPITYTGFPGEKATISGGLRLTCQWEPFRDGIWQCRLPEALAETLDFQQLFVNGQRQIRARYPNVDPASPEQSVYVQAAGADQWPHQAVYVDPATFSSKTWAHPEDGILHIFPANNWGNLQYRIRGFDREQHALLLDEGGRQINEIFQQAEATQITERSRFFIENLQEELDAPGEWYLDRRAGILYYLPPDDVDLSSAVIEVSRHAAVMRFIGTQADPVHHIRVQGLRFAHTEVTYLEPYEAPSLGDWAICRRGAVFFDGAEQCRVENCCFDAVGGNAVFVSHYGRALRIANNVIIHAGESGVCLVGKSHLRTDLTTTCPYCGTLHNWGWDAPSAEIPTECVIHNNHIHDIGVFGKQTAGVFLSLSSHNTISHNHIHHTPRAAICLNDGFHGGHLIEDNDVHDTVLETGDHGPLNSWGRERCWCKEQSHGTASHPAGDVKQDAKDTTIIRRNRFRDTRGWGIDLDDGSSNYHVTQNLCIGISIKLREGDFRLVDHNIFFKGANPPGFHIGYEQNQDRFLRNIIVMDSAWDAPEVDIDYCKGESGGNIYDIIEPPAQGPWFREWDYNLFYSNVGHFRTAVHFFRIPPQHKTEYTLESWQALGYDRHSLFADPLFVDPEHGDFRLKSESPARQLGFQAFDLDQFGLTAEYPNLW